MPRFLDPDSTFKVVLDSDMDKTPTPTFIVKSVSMREHLAIVDALTTQTQSENTVKGVYEIAISNLKKLVVGWSGMVADGQEIPYSPDRIEDLEYKEAVELLNKVGRGTHVDTEQKKKLTVAAAIRQGKLCRYCTGKTCKDIPTEREPIELECPECNGDGCDECKDGYHNLTGCPNSYCGEMASAIKLFDLFEKGAMPVAGGVLDQSAWFINAERYYRQQEATLKAES